MLLSKAHRLPASVIFSLPVLLYALAKMAEETCIFCEIAEGKRPVHTHLLGGRLEETLRVKPGAQRLKVDRLTALLLCVIEDSS